MTTVNLSSESTQSLLTTTDFDEPDRHRLSKLRRPTEFNLATAVPFVSLFFALMITLAVLFSISRPYGELQCVVNDESQLLLGGFAYRY
jgi:hypothetical protein